MRVIIAGSRSVKDLNLIDIAVYRASYTPGWERITEVVSGCAQGVDQLGEQWAESCTPPIPIKRFPAEWKKNGKYNANAGFERNEKMAEYADALIAIWDGESRGTANMIAHAVNHGLKVFVYRTDLEHGLKSQNP